MYVGRMQENFINVFTCSQHYMRLEVQCNKELVNKPYLSLSALLLSLFTFTF